MTMKEQNLNALELKYFELGKEIEALKNKPKYPIYLHKQTNGDESLFNETQERSSSLY